VLSVTQKQKDFTVSSFYIDFFLYYGFCIGIKAKLCPKLLLLLDINPKTEKQFDWNLDKNVGQEDYKPFY